MLLGKLAKSEFGKCVLNSAKHNFDPKTSMKALKDKDKMNSFSTP